MKTIENVTYWRNSEIKGIEICRVDGSHHVFPDHDHDGIYAIALMESGSSYCQGPGKTDSLISPGEIALINPSQVHSGVPARGTQISYQMIYFDLTLITVAANEIFRRQHGSPEFQHLLMRDPRLWRCLQGLCRVMRGFGGRLEKDSAIMEAVANLLAAGENVVSIKKTHRCGRRLIRFAKEFLAEDLESKMALEDVANAAGLSRYHFLRVFKRETGLSPHQFRTLRRIDRAKQLLRNGLSSAQTALMVGFSDQSHFTNTFRKYTGATPGQYLSESFP